MAKILMITDVEWDVKCEPEEMEIEGNVVASGDDAIDRETEDSVRADLNNGNEWAWCSVKVTGRIGPLEACDYLGGCIYENREDFLRDGCYQDMQTEVLAQLQDMANELAPLICDELGISVEA